MNIEELFDVRTEPLPEPKVGIAAEGKTAVWLRGGVGDAIMAAHVIHDRPNFELFIKANHVPLLHYYLGDRVQSLTDWNDPHVRAEYKGFVDLSNYPFDEERRFIRTSYIDKIAQTLHVDPAEVTLKRPTAVYSGTPVSGRPFIAVHTGSSNPNRRLPKQFWHEFVTRQLVTNPRIGILFVGGIGDYGVTFEGTVRGERAWARCLWHPHKSIVRNLQVMQSPLCVGFYGVDSGMCHIAGSLGLNSTVVFTCTDPDAVCSAYPNTHHRTPFWSFPWDADAWVPSCSLDPDDAAATKSQEWLYENMASYIHTDEHKAVLAALKPSKTVLNYVTGVDESLLSELDEFFYLKEVPADKDRSEIEMLLLNQHGRLWLVANKRSLPMNSDAEQIVEAVRQLTT